MIGLAKWNGKTVALKVFDAYKGLSWFENEICAYEHLKDAWGVLVPKPYFIADWRGFVVLGMQMGSAPEYIDREIERQRGNLFDTLLRDYGFVHLDQDPRDVMFLPDDSGTKDRARLVAIDFEAHEILQ